MSIENEYTDRYKRMYEPIFGHWYIKKFIGEGSFAKVFEICRKDFGEEYTSALKIIHVSMNHAEIKERQSQGMTRAEIANDLNQTVSDTISEIRLMHTLRGCTNIVAYEDHEVKMYDDGMNCDILIKMELLTPLDAYIIKNKGVLGIKDILRLGIDICRALELCGKHNIIHRDIKFENIFISSNEDFKLGDFGIARVLERKDSEVSKKGTATYMAPEVYRGEKYDSGVDIYGLGMVLYRLLNHGRAPFSPVYPNPISFDDRDTALMRRMSGEPIPPPHAIAPCSITDAVLKACEYDPKKRYESPAQMRKDLEALLADAADDDIWIYHVQSEDAPEELSKTEVLVPPTPTMNPTDKKTSKNPAVSQEEPKDRTVSPVLTLPKEPIQTPIPARMNKKDTEGNRKINKNVLKLIAAVSAGAAVLMILVCIIAANAGNSEDTQSSSSSTKETTTASETTSVSTTASTTITTSTQTTTAGSSASTPNAQSSSETIYQMGKNAYQSKNYTKAAEYYKQAAELGHVSAMYEIAKCYDNGIGISENPVTACEWYKKAAALGHDGAMYRLGTCYYEGRGVIKSYQTAANWYIESAVAGNIDAMYALGNCYSKGEGVTKNASWGFEWYKKAAQAGHADAMNAVGKQLYDTEAYTEAAVWLKKAAEAGNFESMYYLGDCYYVGNGVSKNQVIAYSWYAKAANGGIPQAMNMAGICCYFGNGTDQNYIKAVDYFKKSAEAGYVTGMSNLANCYYDGMGITQNYTKAAEWYTKAANAGDEDAMYRIGECYADGTGVVQNYAVAISWYTKAANAGNADAMNELGLCYFRGNGVAQSEAKAFEWFKQSANGSSPVGMYNLGYCYQHGIGVNPNESLAYNWYYQSAEAGYGSAMYKLAEEFYSGNGQWRDLEKAAEYYKKAEAAGYQP